MQEGWDWVGYGPGGSPLNKDAPHSPKKRTVSLQVQKKENDGGLKTCPDFDNSATSLGKETDLDTTSEQADDNSQSSYVDGYDDEAIVAIDSDDEDETEYQSGDETSSEEAEDEEKELEEPVVVKQQPAKPVQVQTEVSRRSAGPPPRRGVARRKSFEDEDFPAPPKNDAPRRGVQRNISFEGNDGRIVMCTANRPRQVRRHPSHDGERPAAAEGTTQKDTTEAARLKPKPLPASVTDEETDGKKIQWEKPEWATSPVLKPTRKVPLDAKKIGWEKPEWAKPDGDNK